MSKKRQDQSSGNLYPFLRELIDMAMVESLQKAIEYMEAHLLENLTAEAISKQAYLSPFHFQRMFLILTDMTVGDYIRQRRLTLAAQELMSTDCKIIDLAYKYGYETPEAFAKAFRKHHGVSPSDARKGIGKLQSYNRLSIQVSLKGAKPMQYRIVERGAFLVAGIKHAAVRRKGPESRNFGLKRTRTERWTS
jgi:AraC family transcriptional regulator